MLEVREIRKSFNPGTPNEVRALQGVNFTLENGSFVIIIGTNGSGKSTMLNAVGGTFYVDSGAISLGGADITTGRNTKEQVWLAGFSKIRSAVPPRKCLSRRISRLPPDVEGLDGLVGYLGAIEEPSYVSA